VRQQWEQESHSRTPVVTNACLLLPLASSDVTYASNKLETGKSDGILELSADNFLRTCDQLPTHLSLLLLPY